MEEYLLFCIFSFFPSFFSSYCMDFLKCNVQIWNSTFSNFKLWYSYLSVSGSINCCCQLRVKESTVVVVEFIGTAKCKFPCILIENNVIDTKDKM